ncbi:alternative ribosome rescue aminoacyl-tRNA hydrolase ArfB [Tenacibaculum sp. MEBiC06402]|uniref:alternative ribosome rescue aminoacyl-tRNA hydrolase ArfB n=1 Tax=unclassified Tenacibaculum TaxID=2635139 RepID=UPI003B994E30
MDKSIIQTEIQFKATRSSGPGGQNVNKVASKVELYFNLENSEGLKNEEKELIRKKLEKRISKDGILILTSQESRSQHKNKEIVTQQFFQLLTSSLARPKTRRATKPTRSSIVKKAENKKRQAQKKSLRKKPRLD